MLTMDLDRWASAAVAATAVLASLGLSWAQTDRPLLHAYCSTGDNQWVSEWPPVDSPATVDAMFGWLQETYDVKRVYWRGEQDRMWLANSVIREENPLYHDWWVNWVGHLSDDVRTDDAAVAAARKRGMEVFVYTGMFDYGAEGGAGGCGYFPYATEDNIRVDHPEWCPVDRWGERRAAGPIEWCYPEARRLLVDRYARHTVKPGYDGIAFYTYVENMAMRYMDEFGFNEPIVAEFRRRHGVDIRTQPFDREAWNKLRGEYFTQFLRELHDALQAHGKKLCMLLRPDEPNLTQRWLSMPTPVLCQGGIYMDWEGWVKQGVVDELFIYCGGASSELTNRVIATCKGTGVKVVAFSSSPFDPSQKPFLEQGIALCTVSAPGYGIDPLTLAPTSAETLAAKDWKLQAQTLADIGAGKVEARLEAVAALLRDQHVLVRREAVRTLGTLKAAPYVPDLEQALGDPESSVRIQAATALGKVWGPDSPARLAAALTRDSGFQFKQECLASLSTMGEAARPALTDALQHPQWWVRATAARALGSGKFGDAGDLLRGVAGDPDYRVRYWTVSALASVSGAKAADVFVKALRDDSATVQVRAATHLGDLARAKGLPETQAREAFVSLRRLFREYGDDCRRADAGWGWRPVGMALLDFGDKGKATLEAFLGQRDDRWLAWAAYEVLHIPQSPQQALLCEEAEAIRLHEQYAPPFPGWRR